MFKSITVILKLKKADQSNEWVYIHFEAIETKGEPMLKIKLLVELSVSAHMKNIINKL